MKVTILYTNICNIFCSHCFWGGQISRKRMSDDMLIMILSSFRNLNINRISFSGGEPLIFWEDIKPILNTLSKIVNNIEIAFSTNAFWASSPENALSFCQDLFTNHVNIIEVSCDQYHEKSIPFSYIKNAINASRRVGIDIKVIMSVDNDIRYIKIYSDLRKLLSNKAIVLQRTAFYGYAADNKINCRIPIEKFIGEKCYQILNPCVKYDGSVYACCGPCVADRFVSQLYIGNARTSSMEEIIDLMESNPLFSIFYKEDAMESEYIAPEIVEIDMEDLSVMLRCACTADDHNPY